MHLDASIRATLLIHYYRAMVGRADIWRTRMDATTNWTIGSTAAILSFALGNPASPHYVIHIAAFLTLIFLFLEARRLTFYHLWQHRVLSIERELIRPALSREDPQGEDELSLEDLEREIGQGLGSTIPDMPLHKAVSRRLRRVYIYLFMVQLLAWLMKLASHPTSVKSSAEFVSRADLGFLPGAVTLSLTGLAFAFAAGMALSMGSTKRQRTRSDATRP